MWTKKSSYHHVETFDKHCLAYQVYEHLKFGQLLHNIFLIPETDLDVCFGFLNVLPGLCEAAQYQ